jgi:hypothetical protein
MKIMMNPDEDHHERNNILMFIRDQNVCSEFQVKACGTQDTWHNTIGHPTTDQRLNITCTIAKHTRKQLDFV